MPGFLQRLKQRKLVQWALAYLAGAWALLQLLDMMAGGYGWPTLVMRLALGGATLGFAVALVLAWYHGERGAQALRYAALPFNSWLDPDSGNALEGLNIPAILVKLGERELALGYLEHLADETGGIADCTVMLPALDPIRCAPRFKAVVARLKTTDSHAAKVCGGKP